MKTSKPNDAWTDYVVPSVSETSVPFTYSVESRSSFESHTVDLTQRGGHGACTCTHFRIVANPNFRRHGRHIPYAKGRAGVSECAHIRAALEHYHLNVTIPLLAKFQAGIPRP